MLKSCGAVVVLTVLILPIGVVAFAPPAEADEFIFALGVKSHYATLARTLKIDPNQHRVETPRSDAAWTRGVTFNAAYGHWFFGADYRSSAFIDFRLRPPVSGSTVFIKDVPLDVSELDLAVGYSITPWISPYIGYLRHTQRTDAGCNGCIGMIELRNAGPGLLIHYPLPSPRWAVSFKTALIQGFSLEGGLSYAGIRWPLVGVVGYAYRRIDYPSGSEASCGQGCFRDKDVFSGPTLAVHYVF